MTRQELQSLATQLSDSITKEGLDPLRGGAVSVADHVRGVAVLSSLAVPAPAGNRTIEFMLNEEFEPQLETDRISAQRILHTAIFTAFPSVGAIAQFRSPSTTAWCQAGRDIPCLGSTHAAIFRGTIPCSRPLTTEELTSTANPARAIAQSIVEALKDREWTPEIMPAVLIRHDGPVVCGATVADCVHAAITLEAIARLALATLSLNPGADSLPPRLMSFYTPEKQAGRRRL